MILLADEGIDRQIVEALRSEGHNVVYVAEMEPGAPDDIVLDSANAYKALLITTDKDFGELVFRQGRVSAGVILIGLSGLSSSSKAAIVAKLIRDHGEESAGAFSVVTPAGIRIRHRKT